MNGSSTSADVGTPRALLAIFEPGTYDRASRMFPWLARFVDEPAYHRACQQRADGLVGSGDTVRIIGVTPTDVLALTGAPEGDTGFEQMLGQFDESIDWVALCGVEYHGEIERDLLYSTVRRRLLTAASSRGDLTTGRLWRDVFSFVDGLGEHLHGHGRLSVRSGVITSAFTVTGDGMGHVYGTSAYEEELLRAAIALGFARGGSVIVRAQLPDLFTYSSTPYVMFGWRLGVSGAVGLSEGEVFDDLCHGRHGELVAPDPDVRCLAITK